MKFALICFVIFTSCSVCNCNDLDIYSGLNYDYEQPKEIPRASNYDHRSRYYPKFQYQYDNEPVEVYDESKIRDVYGFDPDKLRQYQAVIDWQISQFHQQHRPTHEQRVTPRLQYILQKLSKNRNLDLSLPLMENLRTSQLDDTAGQPIDNEQEYDEYRRPRYLESPNSNEEYEPKQLQLPQDVSPDKLSDDSQQKLYEDQLKNAFSEEYTTNKYVEAKVVDDPAEFAYRPSDARFYLNTDISTEAPVETTTVSEQVPKLNSPPIVTAEKFHSRKNSITPKFDRNIQEDRKDMELVAVKPTTNEEGTAGVYIIAIVAGISAAATVGLIAVGIGWYNLQKHVKNVSDPEYPAYGITGPNKDISPSGDRRLAQSAQMYHYQHQKQQVIAMERAPPGERHGSVSEAESDEENEEGDYTVYECPGLAPTGEMEVKNPLFQDDPTPAQTPAVKTSEEGN